MSWMDDEIGTEYGYLKYCRPGVMLALPWLNLEFTGKMNIVAWLERQLQLTTRAFDFLQAEENYWKENAKSKDNAPIDHKTLGNLLYLRGFNFKVQHPLFDC